MEESPAVKSEKNEIKESKKIYQICAARYQNRDSAQKHIDTLKKFDVKARLYFDGTSEYRIVVKETDDASKAEKLKSDYDKKGVFCFIVEM